jgi:solute carrier family 35 protein E3
MSDREALLSNSDNTDADDKLKKHLPQSAVGGPLPQLDAQGMRNAFYIALNITSSIGIVMTNKWVFEKEQFKFGTLLTVIHFLFTFLGLVGCVKARLFVPKKIELKRVMPLCLSFCGFVVLTNLSLQYNSVGFYQVS